MSILRLLLSLYLVVLFARLIMEYVLAFNRSYRPSGVMAALFEFVYSVTDPPLKFLRRFIPPLRLGGFALDLSFLVLFLGIQIIRVQLY